MAQIIEPQNADAGRAGPAVSTPGAKPLALRQHGLRLALAHEIHNRPFAALSSPARASHLAMLCDEKNASEASVHLSALCERYNIAPPQAGAQHYHGDCEAFRIKWERHTEFVSYTFIREDDYEEPFADPALALVPEDWLAAMPGELLVGVHIAITGADYSTETISRLFNRHFVVGSTMSGGAAAAWTDFRIHGDGFGRILIKDRELTPLQAGRLLQRLLEIETYRTMALLALPVAREIAPQANSLDRALADITNEIASPEDNENEPLLLHRLTALAARIEGLAAASSYRFGAARAYERIVKMRFQELREQRIEGYSTFREFLERRLAPAMQTCESMAARLETLSDRVSRASHLLRTRVDLVLEVQNSALLASMERRARLQLHLQQTVEGLSVAAISYYLVGLVGVAAKALKGTGLAVNADLVTGLSLPLVVISVWWGVRRVRRRLDKKSKA